MGHTTNPRDSHDTLPNAEPPPPDPTAGSLGEGGEGNIEADRRYRAGVVKTIESGKVDGAGDYRIFLQLALPMMKPALATVGLFLALGYWNEW